MAGMDSAVTALENTLTANLPGTKLKGGTANTGGIYFKDTSSLINLTISDFDVDVTSGATYLPQITDTMIADANGQGFNRFENLAVVGNSIKNDKAIDGAVLGTPSNGIPDENGDEISGDPEHYAPQFMKGVVFMDNYVESTTNRVTGGAMGAWGAYHTVENSTFINNTIKASRVASGSAMAPDHIYNLLGSLFYGNSSESVTSSGRGAIYLYKSNDQFSINLMENTFFIKNTAKGSSAYGAAISDRSLGGLGDIKNSVFALNEIVATGSAYGGVFDAGSGGTSGTSGGGGIHSITGSVFYGNKATAGVSGTAFGGAIDLGVRSAYYTEDADGHPTTNNWRSFNLTTTITDSQFLNNEAISGASGKAWGGAIMVETNGYVTNSWDPNIKTIDFAATGGGATVFSGNKANDAANAIYVGHRETFDEDSLPVIDSNFDVVFNMKPAAGGLVSFDDPITVNMDAKTFTLNSQGQGNFYWNGTNDFNAAGGSSVNFKSGLNILGSDFTLTSSMGNTLNVSMEGPAVINVDLAGRDEQGPALFENVTNLASDGASLSVDRYMIGDFTGTWLLTKNTALAASSDFNLISGLTEVDGLVTSVDLDDSQANQISMSVTRTGTDQVFKKAGENAAAAQAAITDIFNQRLSGQERTATYAEVMNNLSALTPEAAATQALTGQRAFRGVTAEAVKQQNLAENGSIAASAGSPGAGFRLWGGFFNLNQNQDDHMAFSGYDTEMSGGVFGLTRHFSDRFTGGFYAAVGSGDTESNRLRVQTDTNLVQAGLLSSYDFGNGFSLSGSLNYARLKNDSKREGPGRTVYEADFDQKVFGVDLEAAYAFSPWQGGRLRPFLGLRYQTQEQDGFSETGAGPWAHQVNSVESDSFTSTLGASLAHDFVTESGLTVTPEFKAAWVHEFGDEQVTTEGQFLSSPGLFKVKSLASDEDYAQVGASLNLAGGDRRGVSFKLGCDATVGSDYTEHSYYGVLGLDW